MPRGVIRRRLGHARHHHVGIADGLDLFHAVLGSQPVEALHQLVQQRHRALRPKRLGQRHEALEVGEQDGRLLEAVGDRRVGRRLQPVDDRLGQDVAQQRFGLGPRRSASRKA